MKNIASPESVAQLGGRGSSRSQLIHRESVLVVQLSILDQRP
jgi:hypothetical protein